MYCILACCVNNPDLLLLFWICSRSITCIGKEQCYYKQPTNPVLLPQSSEWGINQISNGPAIRSMSMYQISYIVLLEKKKKLLQKLWIKKNIAEAKARTKRATESSYLKNVVYKTILHQRISDTLISYIAAAENKMADLSHFQIW